MGLEATCCQLHAHRASVLWQGLGICCPGSQYPVDQLGWHRQICLWEEVLETYAQTVLEQSWQWGHIAGWHGARGEVMLQAGGFDAGGEVNLSKAMP